MSDSTLVKGAVARSLPTPSVDGGPGTFVSSRMGRYGEFQMLNPVRKAHQLADEGAYFTVQNAQTGIIEGTNIAFAITHPTFYLANTADPTNPLAKSLFPDYLDLFITAAGVTATANAYKAVSVYLAKGNNYTSGGTNLTANITNVNPTGFPTVAKAYFGALTTTDPAVSLGTTRVIVGQRVARMTVTATTVPDVIGDRLRLEFGSVEAEAQGLLGTTGALQANVFQSVLKMPPVVVPPGWSLHICTWDVATTYSTGTTWSPEAAWWER